jgi:hypothetical protein
LLGQYWLERQGREAQYADRLNDQMAFGQQQLHAQLLDQNMRNMTEAAKVPGALGMYASSPYYSSVFQGMDPAAIQQTSDYAAQAEAAKNFQASMTGYNQAAQGGLQLDPSVVGQTGTPTAPALVRAATIHGQYGLAGALARAKAAAGPVETFTDTGEAGAPIQYQLRIPGTVPAAQRAAILGAHGWAGAGSGSPSSAPSAQPTPDGTQPAPAPQPGRTNLPAAVTRTIKGPGLPDSGATEITGQPTPENQALQNSITKDVQTLVNAKDPAAANFQLQGTTLHTVAKDSSGNYYVKGNNGQWTQYNPKRR